jgi:hypothetical protein
MKRSSRAPSLSVRAAGLIAALVVPVATGTAQAEHARFGSTSYSSRAVVGTLSINGCSYQIFDGYSLNAQVLRALCDAGYNAQLCGRDIIVRTRGCRQPVLCWTGCEYDLQSCWKGSDLVLTMARVHRTPQYQSYSPPPVRVHHVSAPVVRKYDTYRPPSWECSPAPRSGVTIFGGSSRSNTYDRGWDRRWEDRCDTGFNVRIDLNNRRR